LSERAVISGDLSEKAEIKEGDEKRWKGRRSLAYSFLLFLFSFCLHATIVTFRILNLT